MVNERVRSSDEALEQRMRLVRLALEFGVKLRRHKKRVGGNLNHFHQLSIRCGAAANKAAFLKLVLVLVVEIVAMAMALVDHKRAVELGRARLGLELRRLQSQSHRAAFLR